MANEVLVSVDERLSAPAWTGNAAPFLQKAMAKLGFDGEQVSVFFCGDAVSEYLNKTYRGVESATDVLSFELGETFADEDGATWLCAGDIAVNLDMLPRNAERFEVDENSELKRLLVHGLLHLNGWDHGSEHIENGKAPQCEMLVLQENVLAELADERIIE